MNKITLNFTPCTPAPSSGYDVKFRVQGSGAVYRYAGNFFASPAVFYDSVNPAGTCYEGLIRSDCAGMFGNSVMWETCESGCVAVDANFCSTTFVSGDSLNAVEIANICGTPGQLVTVTLDHVANSNGGQIRVFSSEAFEGNSWQVLIGSNCRGTLDVEIRGVVNPGTGMLGHFTITSVTTGSIGTPDVYQISKAFL